MKNLESIISITSTPITVCGGLDTLDKCSMLIQSGADRVCIQSLFFNNIEATKQLAQTYGGQSITIKFDLNTYTKKLRTLNQKNFEEFASLFNEMTGFFSDNDIKDFLFYDINADGNEAEPDFSILKHLNLSSYSIILGGGINKSNCRDIHSLHKDIGNDISLSFSNCLYHNELRA